MGRELFISHCRSYERNKKGSVETDGERTQSNGIVIIYPKSPV